MHIETIFGFSNFPSSLLLYWGYLELEKALFILFASFNINITNIEKYSEIALVMRTSMLCTITKFFIWFEFRPVQMFKNKAA